MMLIARRTQGLTLRTLALASGTANRSYSKDYSSSDDEKEPKNKSSKQVQTEPKKADEQQQKSGGDESAASRLNRLLASMKTDDNFTLAKQSASMARPGETNKKRKEAAKQEATSKDVFAAVKRVAELVGGEEQRKQTESELLTKLLGQRQSASDDASTSEQSGAPSKGQAGEMSLSDLIVGMKIDRRQQPTEQTRTRSDFVRRSIAAKSSVQQQRSGGDKRSSASGFRERKREAESYTGSVNLFGGEPLGIFKGADALRESPDILHTWAYLQQRELEFQIAHPPANYFEKMAMWTEQGKAWRFPIDNEQDVDEEAAVDFSEHVFLEYHLEPWCPARGPIRHFMELVCVGLSKNPYITATEKREHIYWYRDYFAAKKDMLKDLMDEKQIKQTKQVDV